MQAETKENRTQITHTQWIAYEQCSANVRVTLVYAHSVSIKVSALYWWKPMQLTNSALAALLTTPCQVWRSWTYPLPYYSVVAADTLRDLDLWTLTLNICSLSPVTWWNYVPNLNAIEQSAAELLRFQCLTLWPWTCLSVALSSGIIFIKFDLRQLIRCLIYSFFDVGTLCQAVTCWPWKFMLHQVSRDQSLYEISAKDFR